ncbi:MAG: DMT family transporter [Rhodocyclaceae bacterium]|nr:DMT family transporter [Rhodocyclaceae bacterium]
MHNRALGAAALTAIAWGLTGIFVFLLPPVSAFWIAGGRLLIGALCVFPWLLFSAAARQALCEAARTPVAYIFVGLLSVYYLSATSGFQHAPVAEVALLLCTAPIFVLLLRRIRGDIPTRREVGGAVLALIGLAWILAPRLLGSQDSDHENHLLGDVLAIAAAACTALYADIYARLNRKQRAPSPLGTTLLTLMAGSVVLLLVPVLVGMPLPAEVRSDTHALWLLLGLGVLCTGIPSLSFAFASQHLPPLVTATISLLIPVFAALFAALFLSQVLPLSMLPGSLVLLSGVALVLYGSKTAPTVTSTE